MTFNLAMYGNLRKLRTPELTSALVKIGEWKLNRRKDYTFDQFGRVNVDNQLIIDLRVCNRRIDEINEEIYYRQ